MRESRKREIRIKAENFRGKCKVGRYGILDLFKECERCGYKLIRYPLGESADKGFSMEKDGDTIIFTNTCYAFCKENFTLAHEIGHVVLHSCDQVPFIPASNEPSSHACMDIWRLPRGSNTPLLAALQI